MVSESNPPYPTRSIDNIAEIDSYIFTQKFDILEDILSNMNQSFIKKEESVYL